MDIRCWTRAGHRSLTRRIGPEAVDVTALLRGCCGSAQKKTPPTGGVYEAIEWAEIQK
jgi:hypothetical protein